MSKSCIVFLQKFAIKNSIFDFGFDFEFIDTDNKWRYKLSFEIENVSFDFFIVIDFSGFSINLYLKHLIQCRISLLINIVITPLFFREV
jgi:hypothetical protein